MAAWLLHAWAQLAAAAAPYALLAGVICWLAGARLGQDTTAKAYAAEQRISYLIGTLLPAAYLPSAVQPGSSPAIAETWHDFPALVNSWGRGTGGWAKYRLLAEGSVEVSLHLARAGTKTDGAVILAAGALPSGYQPQAGARKLPCHTIPNALSANQVPTMSFNTDGSVTVFGMNTSATLTEVNCHGIVSTF